MLAGPYSSIHSCVGQDRGSRTLFYAIVMILPIDVRVHEGVYLRKKKKGKSDRRNNGHPKLWGPVTYEFLCINIYCGVNWPRFIVRDYLTQPRKDK